MNKEKYKIEKSTEASSKVKISIYKKYIIAGIILFVAILGTVIYFYRDNKYKEAIKYLDNQQYEKAYEILESLGGPKATSKIKESKYSRAKDYLNNKNQVSAIILLSEITGFEDSDNLINDLIEEKGYLKVFTANTNDIVVIGEYEQDGNEENGKEPIEWILLDNGKDIILISKNVLDVKRVGYKDNTILNKWLKTEFVENAFDEELYSILKDVKLISKSEVNSYVSSIGTGFLETKLTKYGESKDIHRFYTNEGLYTWWLSDTYETEQQYYTATSGNYYSNTGLQSNKCGIAIKNGVRPVIVISKESNYKINKDSTDFSILDIPTDELKKQSAEENKNNQSHEPSISSSSSSNSSSNNRRKCSGGAVGCRSGFHPCNPNKNDYCVSCCRN